MSDQPSMRNFSNSFSPNSGLPTESPTISSNENFANISYISSDQNQGFIFKVGPLSGIIIGGFVILGFFLMLSYYYIIPSLGCQSMGSNAVAPIVVEKGIMT